MAKNKKENKKKVYRNPANTNWGKILIAVLTIAMVAAPIITGIYFIVKMIIG